METKTEEISQDSKINISYLNLRRNIGLIGILLPLILILANAFTIEPSISHFYYTNASVIFTGTLCSLGLFLFSYRGYAKEDEAISDNWWTNIAGVLIILTAFIPTTCSANCEGANAHTTNWIGTVHLICAAGFLIIMGWMSYSHFTKGPVKDDIKKRRNRLYRISGLVVWAMVLALGIGFLIKKDFTGHDVFIGETIALIFFGTAWLVKGKALKRFGI